MCWSPDELESSCCHHLRNVDVDVDKDVDVGGDGDGDGDVDAPTELSWTGARPRTVCSCQDQVGNTLKNHSRILKTITFFPNVRRFHWNHGGTSLWFL